MYKSFCLSVLCLASSISAAGDLNSVKSSTPVVVLAEIHDDTEWYFWTAELYLSVQSDLNPGKLWVYSLNQGEFDGHTSRYIQLPFDVSADDQLIFTLMDNDELSEGMNELLDAGKVGAITFRSKDPRAIVLCVATATAIQLTQEDARCHKFESLGEAKFIVGNKMPSKPQDANKLSIMDSSRYSRVDLSIYKK